MIFLGLMAIIAVIVMALNMHDNSNLRLIEDYLKSKACTPIVYAKGSYKALCEDTLIEINNGFSVDLKEDSSHIKLDTITHLEMNAMKIIINKERAIEFKTLEDTKSFYNAIEEKEINE